MTTDLGRRIREARLRMGMTQQDVASGIVSAAFLSMVESGRREPSNEVLQRLAVRLGVELSADAGRRNDLLAIRGAIARAGTAIEAGDFASSVRDLDMVDRRFTGLDAEDLRTDFHVLRGLAKEGLGHVDSAVRELTAAVEISEQRGSIHREIEIGIDLVRCLSKRGDLSTAMDRAKNLQSRLPLAAEVTPLHAKLLATLIGLHYARGDQSSAEALADRASTFSDKHADAGGRASELWQASQAAEANADSELALVLAAEARRSTDSGAALLGRLQTAAAWLYTRINPPDFDAAAACLDAAEQAFGSRIGPVDAAMLHAERARVLWHRGDFWAARREVLESLADHRERALDGTPHLIAARVEASLGNLERSRHHFLAAQRLIGTAEPSRTASIGWRELGDVYLSLGFGDDAVLAYQQALTDAGLAAANVAQPSRNIPS